MSPGAALREVLARPGCAAAVGAYDPAVAKLVERAGFPVVYVSGSGSSTAVAGFTDVGLITFTEMLHNARHIIAATSTPTLCDVDTGFGNVTNVKRAIREFESIGAAGVHMEDQQFPKRCGQTAGAALIEAPEMMAKIYAAKEAQVSDDFVLIVRTDARQVEGLEGVIRRGRAYIEAGADVLFPEALLTPEEFVRCREELSVPLVIDVPEWGRSPTMTLEELSEWGFDMGIFAISAMRVALASVREFLGDLAGERTQRSWLDRMMSRAEVDDLVGLPQIRRDEERLAALGADRWKALVEAPVTEMAPR
jgi:2-methylisocitrate lyase-like PEP mutase family enzyme